jgi:hypothetical protein
MTARHHNDFLITCLHYYYAVWSATNCYDSVLFSGQVHEYLLYVIYEFLDQLYCHFRELCFDGNHDFAE